MCCKKIKSWFTCFREQSLLDENQKKYREKFGIVDKYLLQYSIEESDSNDNSYIIFIDYEYVIDWIDCRDKSSWSHEHLALFNTYIAKLELIQSRPIFNLTNKEKLAYKIMLGAAYIQVFQLQFDGVDKMIEEAVSFFDKRNSENARKNCLNYSGGITLGCIVIMLLCYLSPIKNESEFIYIFTVFMGILGAYVSIWGRYTRYELEGVSSKWLYVLESLSRLFIGGIFAFIAMLAIKCGLIFSFIDSSMEIYAYALCGFASGLSERFIPSLIEQMTTNEQKHISQ